MVSQTIHEAMPNIPLSVLRALFENVGHDQSRLLVEVQRGLVSYCLLLLGFFVFFPHISMPNHIHFSLDLNIINTGLDGGVRGNVETSTHSN